MKAEIPEYLRARPGARTDFSVLVYPARLKRN
jgi:hypothetical protein